MKEANSFQCHAKRITQSEGPGIQLNRPLTRLGDEAFKTESLRLSAQVFGCMIWCALLHAYRLRYRLKRSHCIGELAPWQKRRVRELLTTDLRGDLSIMRLSNECKLSISHFAAAFKRSFGISVHKKVIDQRIMTAKTLLLNSTLALVEVAIAVGFSDQASFTRTFAMVTGVPPGKWRKQNRGRSVQR
jgi:AraC-like DNA-binding protein